MTDEYSNDLGSIGETEVRIVAEGPKAQWCADVLSSKFAGIFAAVQQQVEELDN